jgi:hypothetical protein
MSKNAQYFSHDYGARNDPKLQKVLQKLGHEGKSIYWDIIEMLYEEGGKLIISECDSYAFALRTHTECIKSLISDFDLFENDGQFFWSDSILRRLNFRKEKSEKASYSAKFRWNNANASKSDANAMRQETNRNANKVKESKVNNIKSINILSDENPTIKNTSIENFDFRKEEFKKSLFPFTRHKNNPAGLYDREMVVEFFEYWNEPNKSRSKMRWENEKTWDLAKRLLRWSNNDSSTKKTFNKPKQVSEYTDVSN